MEGWMISLALVLVGMISTFAVVKHMVSKHEAAIINHDRKLEKHGDDLVALNTKAESAVTMKDVSQEFVRKEMFNQFQQHTDARFDDLKNFMHEEMSSQKEDIKLIRKALLEVLAHVKTSN